MNPYKPIRQWSDLPRSMPSEALETYALDFKARHERHPSEHAKDIAAFANAFGGVILVGVAENSDSFERLLLPVADARDVARDYENAARDLLAPRPVVDPCVVLSDSIGTLALVAVNVEPYAGQLIGAKLSGTEAWRFPVRSAARHSSYVDPEKAMIYSDPRTRKASILLASIPVEEKAPVYIQLLERREIGEDVSATEGYLEGSFVTADPQCNMVHLVARVQDEGSAHDIPICAPLEDVDAVWKAYGKWHVRLNGMILVHKATSGPRSLRYLSGRGTGNR